MKETVLEQSETAGEPVGNESQCRDMAGKPLEAKWSGRDSEGVGRPESNGRLEVSPPEAKGMWTRRAWRPAD